MQHHFKCSIERLEIVRKSLFGLLDKLQVTLNEVDFLIERFQYNKIFGGSLLSINFDCGCIVGTVAIARGPVNTVSFLRLSEEYFAQSTVEDTAIEAYIFNFKQGPPLPEEYAYETRKANVIEWLVEYKNRLGGLNATTS